MNISELRRSIRKSINSINIYELSRPATAKDMMRPQFKQVNAERTILEPLDILANDLGYNLVISGESSITLTPIDNEPDSTDILTYVFTVKSRVRNQYLVIIDGTRELTDFSTMEPEVYKSRKTVNLSRKELDEPFDAMNKMKAAMDSMELG